MANFSDLPNELLTQIFAYFANHIHLNEFFALRLVARRFRTIIDGTDSLWAGCLGTEEIAEIKNRKISYITYFAERYSDLGTITDSEESPQTEQYQTLKEKGLKKLSNATLILYFPKFREFFLKNSYWVSSLDSNNDFISYIDRESGLDGIIEMAVQYKPIAYFILQDREIRQALIEHQNFGKYITRLAVTHPSIALTLIRADVTLLSAILEGKLGISYIKEMLSAHEETFIAFFQNKELKIAFLESYVTLYTGGFDPNTGKIFAESELTMIARKFNIFIENERFWLDQPSPEALIAHIIHKLMERRQLTIETHPNDRDITRPCP